MTGLGAGSSFNHWSGCLFLDSVPKFGTILAAGGKLKMPQSFSTALLCLAALRQARADFFDQVVDHAETWRKEEGVSELSREDRKLLRSEGTAQIAELFFVIEEGNINTPDALRGFFERHNDDMRSLLATCERGYTRFGLSEGRLKSAVFKDRQIDLVLHESSHGKVTFDQRSIGKVLAEAMSFESCRSLLLLLANSGLLKRNSFQSIVLVSPNGKIEDMYRRHLSHVASTVLASREEVSG